MLEPEDMGGHADPHVWFDPALWSEVTKAVEAAVAPFVRQFAHTDPGWFAAQPWAALASWLAAFEGSELFEVVMQKHTPWQPA